MGERLVSYCNPIVWDKICKLPLTIGIVGESASGKSTITEDFISVLNRYGISTTRINTDDYYYDNSQAVKEAGSFASWAKDKNLDCPEAMELSLMTHHIKELKKGNSVWLPKYDMSGTAIRYDNYYYSSPSDVIISEGLFTMCIKECFDICIYVDIDAQVQKERWYFRANSRNLGSSKDIMFLRAKENASKYIHPYKDLCEIILSGEGPRPKYKQLMEKVLFKIKEKRNELIRSNIAC